MKPPTSLTHRLDEVNFLTTSKATVVRIDFGAFEVTCLFYKAMLTESRDFERPGKINKFDFGIVDTYDGPSKFEIQRTGICETRIHSEVNAEQGKCIEMKLANAVIVGFRVRCFWSHKRDKTNGPFYVLGGLSEKNINVVLKTQRSRGGHWGVVAWYVDRRDIILSYKKIIT